MSNALSPQDALRALADGKALSHDRTCDIRLNAESGLIECLRGPGWYTVGWLPSSIMSLHGYRIIDGAKP